MNFSDFISDRKPVFMDGAMGTMLFKEIPDYSGCFELLNTERPEILQKIHRLYLEAGAQIIETNTFGANPIKLAAFGLASRCRELNAAGAALARETALDYGALVGGSVGPSGLLIAPTGDANPEEIYNAFAEQTKGLADGGADLIIIETMNDIQEARLALIAAKDVTNLPVICSMTFDANGRTMTGSDILTSFATLAGCGASALGINCGMGPETMLEIFKEKMPAILALGLPLCAWANAGLPRLVDGETVYDLSPHKFAETSLMFAELGISFIGGCCGTTPEYIAALKKLSGGKITNAKNTGVKSVYITSRSKALDLNQEKFIQIGERLNPTARKNFAADLKEGKQNFLREESRKQAAEGAHVLDINVGVPGINEEEAMRNSVVTLCNTVDIPLMIDSDNPKVIERGLFYYPGIPIINSINGTEESLNGIIPLIKRFGCLIVALCVDETGIHMEANKRIAIGERIINRLEAEGIDKSRVIVDALMLAESAEPGSAAETLLVIQHFAAQGIKTSIGLSNISFGLPQRKYINNVFLTMAVKKGLAAAIVNTANMQIIENYSPEEILASNYLTGADEGAAKYIAFFSGNTTASSSTTAETANNADIISRINKAVLDGNKDSIEELIYTALKEHSAQQIMDDGLLAALDTVGDKYSSGEFFLPQMLASANTMKLGFQALKPSLTASGEGKRAGRVIICTVKGDIHDIGKNIVAMMLENHGFEVYDLGKDVPAETIIENAEKLSPDIVCLSSLLTTTMGEMKTVANMLEEKGLNIALMIGGAVVNAEYAEGIGAHYTDDAIRCVEKAKRLLGGA